MIKNKLLLAMMLGSLSLPSFAEDVKITQNKTETVKIVESSSTSGNTQSENTLIKNKSEDHNVKTENKAEEKNVASNQASHEKSALSEDVSEKQEEPKKPQMTWVKNQNKMDYNDLIKNIEDGNVKLIVFSEDNMEYNNVRVELNNGEKFRSTLLIKPTFVTLLEKNKIQFKLVENFANLEEQQIKENNNLLVKTFKYISYYGGIVFNKIVEMGLSIFQLLIIFLIVFYLLAKIAGSKGSSGLTKVDPKDIDVSFKDISGNEAAKTDIEEVISFFNNKNKFAELGVKMPSGIIMTGPPGNGKTMFAKAIAKECNADFYSMSGSEFEEMFAGLGAKRVRDLFNKARKSKKAVIFIDEIDSMAKKRGGINSYHEQTLNQLLTEMDGLKSKNKDSQVLVVAATNRIDIIDEAALRPGRFDRKVYIAKPAKKDRIEILKNYLNKAIEQSKGEISLGDLDYDAMGALTNGFSGAELKHLVDESLLLMLREDKKILDKVVFNQAKDKVMLGNQRRDLELLEKERKITAYHEIGHAFVSMIVSKGNRVVEGISIIPHEKALGVTFQTENHDAVLRSKEDMLNDIKVLVGGRAAEKVFINSITNGASNDLQRANAIAFEMYAQYGMSDELPMLNITSYAEHVSENTKGIIEREISKTINESYLTVIEKIKENEGFFHEVAEILLDKEIVNKEEFVLLCEKYNIDKVSFDKKD